jgi:hypothetical protein
MVEPYCNEEEKVSYIEEQDFGVTPQNPTMTYISRTVQEATPYVRERMVGGGGLGLLDPNINNFRINWMKCGMRLISKFQGKNMFGLLQALDMTKSFSIEVKNEQSQNNTCSLLTGCKINQYTMDILEEEILVTMDIIARWLAISSVPVGVAYQDQSGLGPPYTGVNTVVKYGTNTLEALKSLKLTVNNHLERVPVIGSGALSWLKRLKREISVEAEQWMTRMNDLYNDVTASEPPVTIIIGGATTIVVDYCAPIDIDANQKYGDLANHKTLFTGTGISVS